MRCRDAMERMMTADPSELQGGGDSPLDRHLETCSRCAAVAATLARELHGLELGLEPGGWPDDAGAEADRALSAARLPTPGRADGRAPGRPPGGSGDRSPAGRRPRRPRGWLEWRRAWLPLAAAAGVAAVLMLGRPGGERTPPSPDADGTAPAGEGEAPRVTIRPPPDRSAVVMETANPNITIVWLYERGDT